MLSSMDTSPSPAQTSFPSLYATRSDIANSCFRLRLLTVPKQKGYEYVKRKFEPEAEQKQQEQAKLSQIFCTKGTSELQEKNILQIMIETKARLQLMVRDIETIKDGKSYGSMEVSKTEESNLIFLNQFYLNIGVKCTGAALIVQGFVQSFSLECFFRTMSCEAKKKRTHLYLPSPFAMVQLPKSLKYSPNSKEIFILTSFAFILTILSTITTIFIRRADEYVSLIKLPSLYHVNNVTNCKKRLMVRHILQFRI